MRSKLALPGLALLMLAAPAYAHTGVHPHFSLESGLLHPLTGLDHLLAMFAVGLLAAQLGGRAIWLVPGAFVVTMILGALAGMFGVEILWGEAVIVLSVVVIALPVAFAFGLPTAVVVPFVALFAMFHGIAHGGELPVDATAWPFIAGFSLATAVLHAAGLAVGLACGRTLMLRAAGGLVALAGLALAVA